MKPCTKCHQAKPLSEFDRTERTADGLEPQCKACRLEIGERKIKERNKPSSLKQWARGTMANLHLTERDY